jgi:hypothetical protein
MITIERKVQGRQTREELREGEVTTSAPQAASPRVTVHRFGHPARSVDSGRRCKRPGGSGPVGPCAPRPMNPDHEPAIIAVGVRTSSTQQTPSQLLSRPGSMKLESETTF